MHVYDSAWSGAFVLDMRCGAPMFALAPMSAPACQYHYAQTERGIEYSLFCEGEDAVFYWGLGFEEVAAVTSAKEMLRRGWAWELARSEAWLRARQARLCDERLAEMYDLNLFFCIFFSTGVTLDTEEFVLVTSRSPRYYVSPPIGIATACCGPSPLCSTRTRRWRATCSPTPSPGRRATLASIPATSTARCLNRL